MNAMIRERSLARLDELYATLRAQATIVVFDAEVVTLPVMRESQFAAPKPDG
jgi:hypothetical protein